jgi:hypothetical protein
VVTVDVLPEDVLLRIFDFYLVKCQDTGKDFTVAVPVLDKSEIEPWESLLHVSPMEMPRFCFLFFLITPSPETATLLSIRQILDVWPALPFHIRGVVSETSVDDIAPKLRHGKRIVSQITLTCSSILPIENVLAAMQVPFPELNVFAFVE